jgi:hypothetical protein
VCRERTSSSSSSSLEDEDEDADEDEDEDDVRARFARVIARSRVDALDDGRDDDARDDGMMGALESPIDHGS